MVFRRRLIILIGIIFLIIALLGAALIIIAKDIEKRVSRITEIRTQIASINQSAESLATFRADYETAQSYIPALDKALPSHDELFSFIPDLQVMAKKNAVSINPSLAGEERLADNKYGATSFNFTATGPFDNLMSFLETLKNSRYPVQFLNMDLITASKGNYKITTSAKVFSY